MSIMLIIAIFLEHPTPFQYTTFRTVLSLAAAGFAAFIPGFLSVEINKIIRAGGALSAFAVVYFFVPAAIPINSGQKIEKFYTDSQIKLGYKIAFGAKPPDLKLEFPLIGSNLSLKSGQDINTKQYVKDIFSKKSLKIVIPYYTWSPCPKPMWDALYFHDSISPFLSIPIDIIFINLDTLNPPNKDQIDIFKKKFDIMGNFYFLTVADNDLKKIAEETAIVYQDVIALNGKRHIDFSTVGIIYNYDQKPISIIPDHGIEAWTEYRDFLYRLIGSDPDLINRDMITKHIPAIGFNLVSSAYAHSDNVLTLAQVVERTSKRRKADAKRFGLVNCNHS